MTVATFTSPTIKACRDRKTGEQFDSIEIKHYIGATITVEASSVPSTDPHMNVIMGKVEFSINRERARALAVALLTMADNIDPLAR